MDPKRRSRSVYLSLLSVFSILHLVESFCCPRDAEEWAHRASHYRCEADNQVYHCTLDEQGKPFEFCQEKFFIENGTEDCPWYYVQNEQVYRGSPRSHCPSNLAGCPPTHHQGYYVHNLYMYPKCLVSERKRQNETFSAADRCSINIQCSNGSRSLSPQTKPHLEEPCAATVVTSTLLALFFLINVVAVVVIVIRSRKHCTTNRAPLSVCFSKRPWQVPYEDENVDLIQNDEDFSGSLIVEDKKSRKEKLARQLSRDDDPTPMERSAMKNLADHLKKKNTTVLYDDQNIYSLGKWGSGKSTIIEMYCKNKMKKRRRRILQFDCTDMFSLKKTATECLVREHLVKNIREKMKEENLRDIVVNALNSSQNKPIIAVFEDVSSECLQTTKEILERTTSIGLLKIIITVQEEQILKELKACDDVININGFESYEAVEYLQLCFDDRTHCEEIAKLLNFSPVALHFARSYIVSSNLSSGAGVDLFEKLLKGVVQESAPVEFVMKILSQLYPRIYTMLEYLHVIDTHEIPIALIQFMKVPSEDGTVGFQANIFIQVVRKFSFITVTDFDDGRVLNMKAEIRRAIRDRTSKEKKRNCIFTMMKIFSWIFSKRTGPPISREICIQLIPHATKVLKAALKDNPDDLYNWEPHEISAISLLCDRYLYNLYAIGYTERADKILDNLLNINSVLEKLKRGPKESTSLEEFCKETAKTAIAELNQTYTVHQEKINDIAKEFVLGKVRPDRNISSMKKFYLDPIDKHQLSILDYEALIEESKAIPFNKIGVWFVFQSLLNISLTLGLRGLIGTCSSRNKGMFKTENFMYIQFAINIAKYMRSISGFEHMNFYSVLDCEINGAPEIPLNSDKITSLEETESQLRSAVESMRSSGYYVGGVKIEPAIDLCHEINAQRQILRIAIKKKNTELVLKIANEMHDFLKENKENLRDSFHAQCAKQWVAYAFSEYGECETACDILDTKGLSSFDMFDLEHTVTTYDFVDLELKFKCLHKLGKREELRSLLRKTQELKKRLDEKQTTVNSFLPGLIYDYKEMSASEKDDQ